MDLQKSDVPAGSVLRMTNAGEVFVPEGSSFAEYLARKGGHDPAVHYFMQKHGDRLYPFFDVGAHVGIFSIFAARGGPVYAFEPDDANRRLLMANLGRHGLTATILPVAVAVRDGPMLMAPMPCGLSENAAVQAPDDAVWLPARSLASVAAETGVVPGFIKIDVEGGELGVVEGMGDALDHAIVELEFSWRDHGALLDRFLAVRPLDRYIWTIAINADDAARLDRVVTPIDFLNCGLFEYAITGRADLDVVCEMLTEQTAARGSRKWEVCITPRRYTARTLIT